LIYVVRYLLIALYTVFWASFACFATLFDRSGELGVFAARSWARWILWSCGVTVEKHCEEAIDPTSTCVVMSNHTSGFDVVALIATLPQSFRFVAKRELVRVPFFGWGLWAAGHILIDRRDHERSVASLERAAGRIRSGVTVIIFPEGTRSRTGELGAFKSGGFHLAAHAGVPIQPVAVCGSAKITPPGSYRVHPGRIVVRYRPAIPTVGVSPDDVTELKLAVRHSIEAGLALGTGVRAAWPARPRSSDLPRQTG